MIAKVSITAERALSQLDHYNIWRCLENQWFAAADVVKSITVNGEALRPMLAIHVAVTSLLGARHPADHFVGNGDRANCCSVS